jgi:cold shock CspA family protein
MPIGTIAALIPEKPFGFIKPAGGGDDLFFHQTEFKGEFSELTLGLEVTYKNDLHSEKPRALEVALVPSSFGSEIDRPKRHPKSLRKKPKWRKTDEEKDKDAARARVVPGRVVPGRVVPGRVVPGRVVPGRVVPVRAPIWIGRLR